MKVYQSLKYLQMKKIGYHSKIKPEKRSFLVHLNQNFSPKTSILILIHKTKDKKNLNSEVHMVKRKQAEKTVLEISTTISS